MVEKEIIEGNKLIAEFMGAIYSEYAEAWGFDNARIEPKPIKFQGKTYKNCVWAERFEKELKYHSSPEWLFPVLEKICRTKIGDGITTVEYACPRTFGMIDKETGEIMVRLEGHQLFKANTLIEATWLAVVDFIKYYNENNNGTLCTNSMA